MQQFHFAGKSEKKNVIKVSTIDNTEKTIEEIFENNPLKYLTFCITLDLYSTIITLLRLIHFSHSQIFIRTGRLCVNDVDYLN